MTSARHRSQYAAGCILAPFFLFVCLLASISTSIARHGAIDKLVWTRARNGSPLTRWSMTSSGSGSSVGKEVLYDMPVSNHGARNRIIIRSKKLDSSIIDIRAPDSIGGLKSEAYLAFWSQPRDTVLPSRTRSVDILSPSTRPKDPPL
jgi:hypothetical protein